ncbi:hypothetical protein IEQ34_026437 [Dendrobium chrysotoxum]|uniref:RanBP2-type domain-containing protein n=1 Tax=Dendrobium chrysotoxum TaxID=161865 RepID=A0AAV7FM53_DENCH|nr:hypothetical protein IEQ34_026437 [Dendrobium chrysotoxum]
MRDPLFPLQYMVVLHMGQLIIMVHTLPPYDLPAGGSGYPYGYGGRLSVGSPYGPLHMSGPPPYSGGMYGMPPLMDRYGMGMHMGHGAMGPSRPIPYPDEDFQKKPADARHDNDWICPNCEPKMPDGSWKCEKCNNINYPFRTKCNRQNCGAERPSEGNEARGVTSDEDEQMDMVVGERVEARGVSELSQLEHNSFMGSRAELNQPTS